MEPGLRTSTAHRHAYAARQPTSLRSPRPPYTRQSASGIEIEWPGLRTAKRSASRRKSNDDNAQTFQFKKAFRASCHVCGGIMRLHDARSKQFEMEFRETRPLISGRSRNRAMVGRRLHRAD